LAATWRLKIDRHGKAKKYGKSFFLRNVNEIRRPKNALCDRQRQQRWQRASNQHYSSLVKAAVLDRWYDAIVSRRLIIAGKAIAHPLFEG
jgi:hypothetical protein